MRRARRMKRLSPLEWSITVRVCQRPLPGVDTATTVLFSPSIRPLDALSCRDPPGSAHASIRRLPTRELV